MVHSDIPAASVAALARQFSPGTWSRRTVSEGTKGPIEYEFARRRVTLCKEGQPTQTVWLVIKRTLGNDPTYWYYISNAPISTPLSRFVWLSGIRWAIEIAIRDTNAFDGLGQDQCRRRQRIVGANTLRLVMAAARTLWFIDQVERRSEVHLCRHRPWYTQKVAPSQLDGVWACRACLYEAGIFPIPRFAPDLGVNHEEPDRALPLAA